MKTNRSTFRLTPLYLVLILTLNACSSDEEVDSQLSQIGPVRSVQLTTTGSIVGNFTPANVSEAKLVMRCDSGGFAVFTMLFSPDEGWRQIGVSVQTKDTIQPGQTGQVDIDWGLVNFSDSNYDATEFRGPAEFIIDSHDIDAPRMSGSMRGHIPGYGGVMATEKIEADRSIEFEFSFDLNAACGALKK